MPTEIEGVSFYSAGEVAKSIGVSRHTIWRWRQDGKIPVGHRYRDRKVLFTEKEFQTIKEYSNHLDPAAPGIDSKQLRLFNGTKGGRNK